MAEKETPCSNCGKLQVKIEHGKLVVDIDGLGATFDGSGDAVFKCESCHRETSVSFRSEIREGQPIA